MALFAYLIIRLFQLVFSVGTVFFSHNKLAGTVFRFVFSAKRTDPIWQCQMKFALISSFHEHMHLSPRRTPWLVMITWPIGVIMEDKNGSLDIGWARDGLFGVWYLPKRTSLTWYTRHIYTSVLINWDFVIVD